MDNKNYNTVLGYMMYMYNNECLDSYVTTKQFKEIFDCFIHNYEVVEKILKSENNGS